MASHPTATPALARTLPAGRGWTIAGIVVTILALFSKPLLLGPLAVGLGHGALRSGDRAGRWVMLAGLAAIVHGIVIGIAIVQAVQKSGF